MGSLSSLPPERGSASRLAQAQLKARIHTSLIAALAELRAADLASVADLTALQRMLGPVNQALSIQRIRTAIPGRDVRLFQGVREREALL